MKCYHCDPSDLKINGNAGIRMPCLQDEDDLGELKHCALENQLCMKGEMRKDESYQRTILRKIQLIRN